MCSGPAAVFLNGMTQDRHQLRHLLLQITANVDLLTERCNDPDPRHPPADVLWLDVFPGQLHTQGLRHRTHTAFFHMISYSCYGEAQEWLMVRFFGIARNIICGNWKLSKTTPQGST